MSATLELAEALIGRASVTPADGGCQDLIAALKVAEGALRSNAVSWKDLKPVLARTVILDADKVDEALAAIRKIRGD